MDIAVGILFVVISLALYVVPAGIAIQKGHVAAGVLGLVLFPPIAWWGAARMAQPNSVWALRRYGPEELERSQRQYGTDKRSTISLPPPYGLPEVKLESEPESPAEPAAPAWSCLICGFSAPERHQVERHVRREHSAAPVDSSVGPA